MVLIQSLFFLLFRVAEKSRGDWIRTSDLLFPKQAHYQAVLRPAIVVDRRELYLSTPPGLVSSGIFRKSLDQWPLRSVITHLAQLIPGPGDQFTQLESVAFELSIGLHMDQLEGQIDDPSGAGFVATGENLEERSPHLAHAPHRVAGLEMTTEETARDVFTKAEESAFQTFNRPVG